MVVFFRKKYESEDEGEGWEATEVQDSADKSSPSDSDDDLLLSFSDVEVDERPAKAPEPRRSKRQRTWGGLE